MVEIIDPNNHYLLGSGTEDERDVPMDIRVELGDEFDRTFSGLKELFAELRNHQQGQPQRIMIQATMLTWCYAAKDIAALRKEIKDLKEEHSHEIDALGDTLASLQKLIGDPKA